MLRLYLLLLIISSSVFSGILFSDDFNDGNADGWSETGSASYQVITGQYCMYGNYGDIGCSFSGDSCGMMTVADYSFRASVIPELCTFAGIFARFTVEGHSLLLIIYPDYDLCSLYEMGPISVTLLDHCNHSIQNNELYWLRLEVEGSEVKGKIWAGTPEDEPIYFQLSASNVNQLEAGSIGLYCEKTGYDAALSVYYDDAEVTDELSSGLDSRTWGIIKTLF